MSQALVFVFGFEGANSLHVRRVAELVDDDGGGGGGGGGGSGVIVAVVVAVHACAA